MENEAQQNENQENKSAETTVDQKTEVVKPIAKKRILEDGSTELDLPSGKKAVITDFKGKHIRQAQRLLEGYDAEMYIFCLISVTTQIDGRYPSVEELDEVMPGFDVLMLQYEFSSANF